MIEKHPFGRTGHISSRTLFGAAAFGGVTQAEADRTLDILLEYGVNHIDTAASYGRSEELLGPGMQRLRHRFFLATKVEERTYKSAWDSIRRSLKRLRVEQVDLLQLHHVSTQETWDQVMGPEGALQAVLEAQQQGLTRFIGITGHDLDIARLHLAALERVEFDSVLLPYNYALMQNAQYAADFEALMTVCAQRQVAVQLIKTLTRRPWGKRQPNRNTWYQPLEEQAAIDAAVHWTFATQPAAFLNTAGDLHILPRVLDAASRFNAAAPLPDMVAVAAGQGLEPLFT